MDTDQEPGVRVVWSCGEAGCPWRLNSNVVPNFVGTALHDWRYGLPRIIAHYDQQHPELDMPATITMAGS